MIPFLFYDIWKKTFYGEQLPYGSLIDTITINGVQLEIYSNKGFEQKPSTHNTLDDEGEYLAIQYQCPELVRRYLYKKTGINFATQWKNNDPLSGHSSEWFPNAQTLGLKPITNTQDLQEGDILCYEKGINGVGHVALVRKNTGTDIFIAHQNIFQNHNDVNHRISVQNPNFLNLKYQGALRIPKYLEL